MSDETIQKIGKMSGVQARIALRFLWLLITATINSDVGISPPEFRETLDIALTYEQEEK